MIKKIKKYGASRVITLSKDELIGLNIDIGEFVVVNIMKDSKLNNKLNKSNDKNNLNCNLNKTGGKNEKRKD